MVAQKSYIKEILDDIIPADPEDLQVSEEAYELLERWCDKVTDAEERAKLSIKMMEFMDWSKS